MGASIAAAIFSIMADLAGAVTALCAFALFISGILILTNIGGQGIQKHVRGALLSIILGAIFCFGANRIATKFATDFKAAASGAPANVTPAAPPAAMSATMPVVYDTRLQRSA